MKNESTEYLNLNNEQLLGYIGMKIGDINTSAEVDFTTAPEARTSRELILEIQDVLIEPGKTFTVPVRARDFENINGMQFELEFATGEFVGIESGELLIGEGNFAIEKNKLKASVNFGSVLSIDDGDFLFYLNLTVAKLGKVSELLAISSDVKGVQPEAYQGNDLDVLYQFCF